MPQSADNQSATKERPKAKATHTTTVERMPYLDVEWGESKFLQIQYTGVLDLFYSDHDIIITTSRFLIAISINDADGKPAFDLSKFRQSFQTGRVSNLCERADLGFHIKVKEITKAGLREI